MSTDQERQQIIQDFEDAVNMTPKQLESWLQSDKSQSVGQHHEGEDEAIGHKSGRYILTILNKKKADYDDDDLDQMKRVVSYVHRHLAQEPSGDIQESRWRYSLMNWGHDPMKDQ